MNAMANDHRYRSVREFHLEPIFQISIEETKKSLLRNGGPLHFGAAQRQYQDPAPDGA